jgi:hypothetical protein
MPGWASEWAPFEMSRKGKGPENSNEYDFSKIPNRELAWCCFYENARESSIIVQVVEEIREQHRKQLGSRRRVELRIPWILGTTESFQSWFMLGLAANPAFPRIPWGGMKQRDRQQQVESLDHALKQHKSEISPFLAWSIPRDSGSPEPALVTPDAVRLPKNYELAVIAVKSTAPRDQVSEGFLAWHCQTFPHAPAHVSEKPGRFSYRDRLNALGALRLRFYCRTLREAQVLVAPLRNVDTGLCYRDRKAWNRACERALEYFREILHLPTTHFPIHNTKGWLK